MKYLILSIFIFLTACQAEETKDYSWYMRHPMELQQASRDCQANAGHGDKLVKCEMIMRATVNMTAIVNEFQRDPEKFGQRVIDAEEKLATLAESPNNQKSYADQVQEVKVDLAVIGLASPE